MTSIAGGMESDMSDSDGDLVCPTSSYTGFEDKISSNKNESKTLTKVDHNQPKTVQHKNHSNSAAGYGSVSNKHTKSYNPMYQNNSRRSCIDTKTSQLYDDLRYAIMQGSLDITKEIIEKGVRVDTILKAGWTGLMHACSFGRYEIVSFLLENKADPNYHKDSDLFTPLMAVCASKKEEEDLLKCCHLLLEKGAHVNVHERYLTTPLMFAVREGHMKIVETLLEHGADVHMSDNKKCTALSWAASCGFGQIVRLLLKKGADPHHVDANAQTPADLAYSQGHNEIASLLEKSTATEDHVSCDKDENSSVNYESTGINQRKRNSKALSAQSDGNIIKYGELEIFLAGLGFQELTPLFREHQLNLSELLIMNEEELEKIGIQKFGDRKKILEASKAIHKTKWETTSLTNLKQRQYISCPDAVAMMSNIAKHLKYISSTVIFVRQQIQSQPRILELSQDSANVHNLLDEMEESLKNVRFLNDELRFFKLHLDKVQDNGKYIPADLIVETVNTRSKTFKFVLGISIVSVAVGAVLWKNPNVLHSVWCLNVIKSHFPKFSLYFPRTNL